MLRHLAVVPLCLPIVASCTDEEEPLVDVSADIPRCAPSAGPDDLTVSGTVVDFVTRAPLAGVTVDVADAWRDGMVFPGGLCSLATMVTGPDGKFGPIAVAAGSNPGLIEARFVVFFVRGADVAPVTSDQRVSCGTRCSVLDHEITAPTAELGSAWRSELRRGGMEDARTRGLVAFEFREPDDRPASGVAARRDEFEDIFDPRPFVPGDEVRYVEADRVTVAPASQASTRASGLALIGIAPSETGTRSITGVRDGWSWGSTGCLIGRGWLFVEDDRPPSP